MKLYKLAIIISVLIILVSCNDQEGKTNATGDNNRLQEKNGRNLGIALYEAVYRYDVEKVNLLLEEGADPNSCIGEFGWADSNPLNVVSKNFYNTYYRRIKGDVIPDPMPDVATMELLVKAGADVKQRPYIWYRIYLRCDTEFLQIKAQREADKLSIEPDAMKEEISNYVEDTVRLIDAFIRAGADVDMLGDPFPYSRNAFGISSAEANAYFAKGSRPINLVIERGIIWAGLVDLLLKYTKLDEESLRAAQRSNDQKMIEKINNLWKLQNNDNG